VRKEAVY